MCIYVCKTQNILFYKKDSYRKANILNLGDFMHKYLPDFVAFNALGGKPFKLEMTLPTYVNPYNGSF